MNVRHFAAAALMATMSLTSIAAVASTRSTVLVVNNSSEAVLSIMSSPVYRSGYGRTDLLGSSTVLRPGYQVAVDFNTYDAENECLQDVMAVGTRGTRWSKRMNICRISKWTLGE